MEGQTTSLSFPVVSFTVKDGEVNINMDLINQVWEETQLPAKLGGKKLSSALFKLLGDHLPSGIKLTAANRHVETLRYLATYYYVDALGNVRKKIGKMIDEVNDLIVVDKREDAIDLGSEISVYTVMVETLLGYLVKNHAGLELISIEIYRKRNVEALRYLLQNVKDGRVDQFWLTGIKSTHMATSVAGKSNNGDGVMMGKEVGGIDLDPKILI